MNAGSRTLTVFGNAIQYSWSKIGINSAPEPGGNGNTFVTQDKYLGIRCYLKDATGNWHISQSLNVGKYDNQREGIDILNEKETEQPGFELNAYPNPFTQSFTVAFDLPDDNSYVKLEIINKQGSILRTVVDNPHAKGKWQYEVKELPDSSIDILFCRLKINESYTIKKLLHVTN